MSVETPPKPPEASTASSSDDGPAAEAAVVSEPRSIPVLVPETTPTSAPASPPDSAEPPAQERAPSVVPPLSAPAEERLAPGSEQTAPRTADWGCVAAWGAVLLIPVLLVTVVLLPLLDRIRVLDEDYERGLDQLYRYQRLVATLPGLRRELEQEQANDDFKAFYFDAETPALAGARLQSEVQEMVRGAGGRPISTQILPVDDSERPPRVRIRTQMQGTTEALLDVLYKIESARPFLFVDQLSIRSTTPRARPQRNNRRRGRAPQPVRPGQQVGQLTVRLDIFGYVLGSGG
jgi:general secretion pathway protein M